MTDQIDVKLAPVSVETFMLRVGSGGRWFYRRLTAVPGQGESPDDVARRLGGLPSDEPSTVVHSTSWRHRPEGQVVLTYAVCPDPAPHLPAEELPFLDIAQGSAPAAPTPERISITNVASHAIRHLAFLLATDAMVRRVLLDHPPVAGALEELAPLTMTRLDDISA
ncbi:hypothetical protein FXF51_41165 [Nonomuraea sp. PA05]|uniref:hypothetical protein n=1 Tax=Nonomuraea sp. PA05 TaxID=2604466 RepID=UPI0011D9EA06|nr:hypothetical protein [Nonomuraea sp. PA05]TYB57234.1 hypothetical protein FXF51_41165 [Nonomuraea sp. PA05]